MDYATKLLELPIWSAGSYPEDGSPSEHIRISYERARSVVQYVGMTTKDIVTLSPKFRDFHTNFLGTADSAVATILSTHWNLCMGTIAAYAEDHSDSYASEVLLELQEFRSVGEFMLTEVAHGSDASNLETTATYNNDGSFDLHTPNPMAAKSMPPTSPEAGMPRIAVVFAQLIVNGEHRGIRPFIVRLCDADKMAPGISSRLLPRRNGPKYVDHCITMFNHVRLEPSAFLGTLNAAKDLREELSRQVHRLTVGALCLAMSSIPILRVTAFVLGRYGQRQHVAGPKLGEKVPKAYFASQHGPALVALTLSSVLEAYAATVWEEFCWEEQPQLRDSLAGIFKTAAAIDSQNPTSLLAKHEYGVWKEAACQAKAILSTDGSNRDDLFNAMLLPRCRKLVLAIGHRMAYEAAVDSSRVTIEMLRLYEATCMLEDPGWYVENTKFTSSKLDEHHAMVVRALLPSLDRLLDESGAAAWVTSPIVTEERWTDFVGRLPEYTSDGCNSKSSSAKTSRSRVRVNAGVWDNSNHASMSESNVGDSGDPGEYLEWEKLRASQPVSNLASRNCNCL
ncbi:acyl-CoA oxidase, partial [Metarhizium majus ARSEF 297]